MSDIEAARAELVDRGVDVSEVFHRAGPGKPPLSGPDPQRRTYASFATFSDPDGNRWLLQEITARLPGRVDADVTTFTSPAELAAALRRAAAAHGEHEKRTGQHDTTGWPDWYAEYMVSEQAGKPLPIMRHDGAIAEEGKCPKRSVEVAASFLRVPSDDRWRWALDERVRRTHSLEGGRCPPWRRNRVAQLGGIDRR